MPAPKPEFQIHFDEWQEVPIVQNHPAINKIIAKKHEVMEELLYMQRQEKMFQHLQTLYPGTATKEKMTDEQYMIAEMKTERRRSQGTIAAQRREIATLQEEVFNLRHGVMDADSFARGVNRVLKRHGAKVRLSARTDPKKLVVDFAEILWNICGREKVED